MLTVNIVSLVSLIADVSLFLVDFICCFFSHGSKFAGPSKALPRCALPKYLIEELQKHIPNAIFVSNPCRFDMEALSCVII